MIYLLADDAIDQFVLYLKFQKEKEKKKTFVFVI